MSAKSMLLFSFLFFTIGAVSHSAASEPHPEETAAIGHIEAAEIALKNKEFGKAVTQLETAVRLVPNESAYRLRLANAYIANQQLDEAWLSLRKAATLSPGDKQISDLFSRFWNMFDKRGLFNVGQPVNSVERILGKPDQRVQVNDRDRLVYGFYSVDAKQGKVHELIDLRGLKSQHMSPTEIVSVELDGRGWHVDYRVNNQLIATSEYVLPNEKIQNWSELVSVQRLHGQATTGRSLRQVVDGMMTSLKKTNPDRQYRVLSQDKSSILFEWKTGGGKSSKAQHELVRLFYGPRDMHRLAYVKKVAELTEEHRKAWIRILSSAKLQSVSAGSVASNNTKKANPAAVTRDWVWKLGTRLSGAAIIHSQGVNQEKALATLESARAEAAKLGIKLDTLPELEDDSTKNTLNCVNYLMSETGRRIHRELTENYDRSHAALLEVAIKSNMLILMYVPNDSTGKALAQALKDRTKDAQVPEMLFEALFRNIESAAERKLIVMNVLKLQTDIKLLLEKLARENGGKNKLTEVSLKAQLQGVWKSIRVEADDSFELPPAGESLIVFKNDRVSFIAKGEETIESTYEIDISVTPNRIVWIYDQGDEVNRDRVTEIMKIEGDKLFLCAGTQESIPTDFAAPAGSDRVLIVYKKIES